MQILRCIATQKDDELLALGLLKQYISKFPSLHFVRMFADAVAGVDFQKHTVIDFLLVDINRPDIKGIDLGHLPENKPMFIFTIACK